MPGGSCSAEIRSRPPWYGQTVTPSLLPAACPRIWRQRWSAALPEFRRLAHLHTTNSSPNTPNLPSCTISSSVKYAGKAGAVDGEAHLLFIALGYGRFPAESISPIHRCVLYP